MSRLLCLFFRGHLTNRCQVAIENHQRVIEEKNEIIHARECIIEGLKNEIAVNDGLKAIIEEKDRQIETLKTEAELRVTAFAKEKGDMEVRIVGLEREKMEIRARYSERMDKLWDENSQLLKAQEKTVNCSFYSSVTSTINIRLP